MTLRFGCLWARLGSKVQLHMKQTSRIGSNTVNSCHARYFRRALVLFALPKLKHLQMPMSFLQRRVRNYTGIHSSLSLSPPRAVLSSTFCRQCRPQTGRPWTSQHRSLQLCILFCPTSSGGPSSPTQSTRTFLSWG